LHGHAADDEVTVSKILAFARKPRPGVWALVVAAVFALIAIPNGPGYTSPDMTEYLNQTHDLLGKTPAEARESTIQLFCGQFESPRVVDLAPGGPFDDSGGRRTARQCVDRLHAEGTLPNGNKYGPAITKSGPVMSPRYEAIFLSRPGVAVLYAPAVALLPDRLALGVTAIGLMLIGGLLIYQFLRVLKIPPAIAILGQTLYYVLPTGKWSIDPKGEAAVLALTAALLLGVAYVVSGRNRPGLSLLAVAFVGGFFVKFSQFMLIGAALTATAALAVHFARRAGRPVRPLLIVAGTALAGTLLQVFGAMLLGWPGGSESMQDLLTDHFARPDVPDPVTQWLHVNRYYWPWWLSSNLQAPLALCAWLLAAWGLWRARSRVAFVVFAVALSAFGNQFGHPAPDQGDRLIVSVWFLVICGLPILLAHLIERRDPAAAPEPAPRRIETAPDLPSYS
jgi:hypothetical protein